MTFFTFANNINTTLANAVAPGDTSITLASSIGLPATIPAGEVLAITLNDAATRQNFEIMYVTAIAGATITVTRAQEGTVPQSWLGGDFAFSGVTAAQMVFAATNSRLNVQPFTSSGPFVVPIGVTTLFASGCAPGGGGAGGGGSIANAGLSGQAGSAGAFGGGGGGGGGAGQECTKVALVVTPGETLTIAFGAPGGGGVGGSPTVNPTGGGAAGNLVVSRGATPILSLQGGGGAPAFAGSYAVDTRAGASGGAGGAGGNIVGAGGRGPAATGGTGGNGILASGVGGAGASSGFGGGGRGGGLVAAGGFNNPPTAGATGGGGGGGGGIQAGSAVSGNGANGAPGGPGYLNFEW